MRLTLQERLDCPMSYATEETPHLMCGYMGACDGELYETCCWENEDLAFRAQREIENDRDRIYA